MRFGVIVGGGLGLVGKKSGMIRVWYDIIGGGCNSVEYIASCMISHKNEIMVSWNVKTLLGQKWLEKLAKLQTI